MVADLLASQGYRVGLYTSPHLVDFSERIQINGHAIPSEWVRELTECVRTAAESHLAEPPTFFEATTVVAFAYFAEMRVDRKSTRLNSSHVRISYAVFCLKK